MMDTLYLVRGEGGAYYGGSAGFWNGFSLHELLWFLCVALAPIGLSYHICATCLLCGTCTPDPCDLVWR